MSFAARFRRAGAFRGHGGLLDYSTDLGHLFILTYAE